MSDTFISTSNSTSLSNSPSLSSTPSSSSSSSSILSTPLQNNLTTFNGTNGPSNVNVLNNVNGTGTGTGQPRQSNEENPGSILAKRLRDGKRRMFRRESDVEFAFYERKEYGCYGYEDEDEGDGSGSGSGEDDYEESGMSTTSSTVIFVRKEDGWSFSPDFFFPSWLRDSYECSIASSPPRHRHSNNNQNYGENYFGEEFNKVSTSVDTTATTSTMDPNSTSNLERGDEEDSMTDGRNFFDSFGWKRRRMNRNEEEELEMECVTVTDIFVPEEEVGWFIP